MFVRFMIFSGKYCQISGYQQLKSKRRRYFLPHEEEEAPQELAGCQYD